MSSPKRNKICLNIKYEWWVKIRGNQSSTSIEDESLEAYSYKVATYGSCMFPRWMNMIEDRIE